MPDKTAIGISSELRQYIEALVEEVVLEGKPFEDYKKYLRRFCNAEGVDYFTLERNLIEFIALAKNRKASHKKGESLMAKSLRQDIYLSKSFIDQLLASTENTQNIDEKNCDTPLIIRNGIVYGNRDYDFKKRIERRIEIPPVINGETVNIIGDFAFKQMGLESVVIPPTVNRIGFHAFERCGAVVIVIPDSVTAIEEGAFSRCSNLIRIDMPKALRVIETKQFFECKNLIEIDIPQGVTLIRREAFRDCGFTSMVIPDSVSVIESMAFYCCKSLSSLTLSKKVTRIDDFAFGSCKSLISLVIPDSVISLSRLAIIGCDNLKDLTIGHDNYNIIKDTLPPSVTIHFSD